MVLNEPGGFLFAPFLVYASIFKAVFSVGRSAGVSLKQGLLMSPAAKDLTTINLWTSKQKATTPAVN